MGLALNFSSGEMYMTCPARKFSGIRIYQGALSEGRVRLYKDYSNQRYLTGGKI